MKIKINQKNIFKYLYYGLLLLSFFLIYLVYDFGKTQVYNTIYTSDYVNLLKNKKYVTDLNVNNFNEILDKIRKKSQGPEQVAVDTTNETSTSSQDILN